LFDVHKANHRRAAILDAIEARTGEVAERMAAATLGEVPQYGGVRDPRFGAEVLAHSADHVRAFLRSARRGRPPAGPELDFVRSRGAARAGELFSIDALIQAYHLGQRSVWEAIVDEAGDDIAGLEAALDLTAATFAYTQAITTALVDAYVEARRACWPRPIASSATSSTRCSAVAHCRRAPRARPRASGSSATRS
jgi:hypothetical protein